MDFQKDIKGYEGLYLINKDGIIKSVRNNKIMKQTITKGGYFQIGLRKDGKQKFYRVHRLVAETFIANPEGKPEIDHIDRDKSNNNVNNLR